MLKQLVQLLISWGPFGLLLLAVLDSAGVPIVGGVDALLIAVATIRPAEAYPAALLATVGSVLGSLILFSIARKGGEVFLEKHISHGRGARLHRWFETYGLITVFIPAISPLPLPMKITVLCAGALEVRFSFFLAVVTTARLIRYFALAYLGQHYGRQTIPFLKSHWLAVVLTIVLLAIATVIVLRVRERQSDMKDRLAIGNR